MSDGDDRLRLAGLLRRLAEAGTPRRAGGRPLDAATGLRAAFLREIDETILPRRLTFAADSGVRIVCDAYARRLLAAVSPLPAADVLDQAALRLWLDDALAEANSLHVTASTPLASADPTRPGVAARTLAAEWGIVLDLPSGAAADAGLQPEGRPSGTIPARFREALQGAALAWIALGRDGREAGGGAPDMQAELGRRTPALLAALHALPGGHGQRDDAGDIPRCLVLASQRDDFAGLVAGDVDGTVLALFHARDASRAAALWQQATAGCDD